MPINIEQEKPLFLSIVIPCYNEDKRIGKTLESILSWIEKDPRQIEVIIVDDGSQDHTEDVCHLFDTRFPLFQVLSYRPNHGKGFAVRQGMLAAKGQYRLFMDADGSTPITEVDTLLKAMEKTSADIIIGSRSLPQSKVLVHQPWYREKMGKTFNKFVQTLVIPGFIDTQCGFKLLTAAAAEKVFAHQKLDGFAFDVEILYLAKLFNIPVAEIPVSWVNSPQSKVNPIQDSLKMLRELVKIKRLHKSLINHDPTNHT